MSEPEEKATDSSERPRGRTGRSLPDLGGVFEEVDSQAETQQKPAEKEAGFLGFVLPAFQEAAQPEATQEKPVPDVQLATVQAEARPARRRDKAALFSLLGDEEGKERPAPATAPKARQVDLGKANIFGDEEGESQVSQLEFPAELETYLSADLWRKLKSPSLARGALFNALERVRSVLYLVSTFMPAYLVQEKMRRPVAGLVSGQILRGSLLFSDVSGFTPLSERLAVLGPQGAERVTAIMNQYFAAMLEIISWSGGTLIKFAGDAMLVFFPEQESGEHSSWAVRVGQRMLHAMNNFTQIETPKGPVRLQMKIGLATGEFMAASVGSEKRMEYFVIGTAVTQTMGAEGKTTGGGQLVVNEETALCLGEAHVQKVLADGFYLLKSVSDEVIDDYEIKAETRRARGAVPWNASPRAILAQIEVALRQIQAVKPYLPPELVDRIVVHARRRQVDSEYRPTTVMFCNFTGPEALLDLWGPGNVQRITSILNAYFASMQEVVARYGGIISRVDPYSKGTKMLILFGAPVAHEDDPQRAVSAALAMNAELEALDETWRRKFARYLPSVAGGSVDQTVALVQHRMGITFGQTFAGQVGSTTRREYTVMGDEVNLAARLMSVAEMGQILIEQQVQKAVADFFVLNALPLVRVKGKSKPISVFQVAGPRDDTLASRARSREQLIGRNVEIEQASSLLDKAMQGSGAILFLLGSAGIGKSHMADNLINRAIQKDARTLFVNCRSYNSDMPYAAWSTFLRSLAGITSIDYQPRVHYARLRALMTDLDIPVGTLHTLAALMGLSRADLEDVAGDAEADEEAVASQDGGGEQAFDFIKRGRLKRRGSSLDLFQELDRQRASDAGQTWIQLSTQLSERERSELYEAVWNLLTHLTLQQPVVIFFEDAQWIDELSRDLLRFLDQRVRQIPLFLMLACRGEAMVGCEEIGFPLVLKPMGQLGTTALVSHILVSDLAQVIYEQSGGVPLFIEEITRWFKRTRNISAEELRSVMQSSNLLQKLILSGLESLPEMQREIGRVGAVIGNSFRTGEVQAMLATQVDAVTLSNHLRSMVRERLFLLEEAGADARYAFQQSLVRDILYNSLPFEQRVELHARLAEFLTKAPSSRRQVQSRILAALDAGPRNLLQEEERIAYHFEQSTQWLPAAEHYYEAGKQAFGCSMLDRAMDCFNQGLVCLEKLPAEELGSRVRELWSEIALAKGDLALETQQYLVATSAFELAQAKQPANPPVEKMIALANRLALVLPTQNRPNEAIKTLEQALQQPEARRDLAMVSTMTWLLWRAGKPEAAHWLRKAKTLARKDERPWAIQVKAMLFDLAGSWTSAKKVFRAAGLTDGVALVCLRVGDRLLADGQVENALKSYQAAVEIWRNQSAETGGVSLALYQQAGVYWNMGDLETTQHLLEEALTALPDSAAALQASGRVVIQRALKAIGRKRAKRLPVWNWQAYDDTFRIAILRSREHIFQV
jgi:class 3 adenylate cyclase/tetratricopeptide (TPR) repeat protein